MMGSFVTHLYYVEEKPIAGAEWAPIAGTNSPEEAEYTLKKYESLHNGKLYRIRETFGEYAADAPAPVELTHAMVIRIGEPAMLEQLAEESAELAHAALRLAKIERGENPSDVERKDAEKALQEEFSDVISCTRALDLAEDEDLIRRKIQEFIRRWEKYNAEN